MYRTQIHQCMFNVEAKRVRGIRVRERLRREMLQFSQEHQSVTPRRLDGNFSYTFFCNEFCLVVVSHIEYLFSIIRCTSSVSKWIKPSRDFQWAWEAIRKETKPKKTQLTRLINNLMRSERNSTEDWNKLNGKPRWSLSRPFGTTLVEVDFRSNEVVKLSNPFEFLDFT